MRRRAPGSDTLDTQLLELLGRNRLIEELTRAGLEVAIPARDRGVDLIAYLDLTAHSDRFVACPIQLKAATATCFSVDRKYEAIADLLIVYLWGLATPHPVFHAMTYAEAVAIADAAGWTRTASWARGGYTRTAVGAALKARLRPHRMTRERWPEIVQRCARRAPR